MIYTSRALTCKRHRGCCGSPDVCRATGERARGGGSTRGPPRKNVVRSCARDQRGDAPAGGCGESVRPDDGAVVPASPPSPPRASGCTRFRASVGPAGAYRRWIRWPPRSRMIDRRGRWRCGVSSFGVPAAAAAASYTFSRSRASLISVVFPRQRPLAEGPACTNKRERRLTITR